jgi:preprotein translocase subunit SecF
MNILRYSNAFLLFSAVFVIGSVGILGIFGLNFGIEFTGGSLLEASYNNTRPQITELREKLEGLDVGLSSVQEVGESGILIRMTGQTEEEHQRVVQALGEEATELRFDSIGSSIGEELRSKALLLGGIAFLVIILYVSFAFRRITKPVHSWQWSLAALGALAHDVLLPIGMFVLLGEFMGVSITVPVLVALLTVVGYSVNDTVVVFDRIRENLDRKVGADFADTINQSLRQSFSRSFNTSLTTLFVVLAIFFFGGQTLQYFALTMVVGIVAGTYSSLFLAPVLLERLARRIP